MNVATLRLLPHQQCACQVDLPQATYPALLKARAAEAPSRDFLIFPETDRQYSYRQFWEISMAAAEWLSSRTKNFGTIAVIFRNTPEFLAVFFGAVARGITVVPINPDLATAEIQFIVENSDCEAVFYDPELEGKIAPLKTAVKQAQFYALADVASIPAVDVIKAE